MTVTLHLLDETDQAIMRDLARKIGDDVEAVIFRVLQIAPGPHLPLLLNAAMASTGALIAEINAINPDSPMTKTEMSMLGALIVGRAITDRDVDHALDSADADLNALRRAARPL